MPEDEETEAQMLTTRSTKNERAISGWAAGHQFHEVYSAPQLTAEHSYDKTASLRNLIVEAKAFTHPQPRSVKALFP